MTLSASSELPIIDFTEEAMKPGTKTWDLTSQHVLKALEEYGCFMATFNEINHELYTAIFRSVEKLFDLPKDTKREMGSGVVAKVYTSDLAHNPLYESMAVRVALSFETIQNFTHLMWPQGDDSFCKTIHSYLMIVYKIEKTVRKMIFQNYGVEFEEESELMKYSTRMMKYGAPMSDDTPSGSGSHYDPNLMTLLQADGVGLQVYTKSGEWIDATPTASSLIVMAGETFHGWSNGRLRCPLHQVKVSGPKPRYSIGLFSRRNGTIEIPNELVDDQHPMLFKPFDVEDLLRIFKQKIEDKTYTGKDDNLAPFVATHFAI